MTINKFIGHRVHCGVCGHTDFQDHFKLADLGDHDVQFVCDGCEPLPEPSVSFRERFQRDFQPTPQDVIGLVFFAIPILLLCVISFLAGGGK